jgi:hypothetical protein
MPIRSPTSNPTSAAREDQKCSSPEVVSVIDAEAFSCITPSPRFLGRDHSGVRRTTNRRPRTSKSSTTSGRASRGACWDLSALVPRAPGTVP